MNKTASLIAFATAAVLAGGAGLSAAQDPAPQTPAPAPQATAPLPQADRASDTKAKTMSGELVKVDVDAKTIAIKDANGMEQTFSYTDTIDVTGSQTGVSGLATKAGSKVKVHFTGEGATRVATKIEPAEKDKQ